MIPPEDLLVELWPPRQRGGQTVGNIHTGVKVTHIPSDTVAVCTSARSQHVNKQIAIEMIESAVTHPRFYR